MLALPDDAAGVARSSHRPRETALQRVAGSAAIARISRASRALTSAPGQALDYEACDVVDFYFPSGQRGIIGWSGPASVVNVETNRGAVEILSRGRDHI